MAFQVCDRRMLDKLREQRRLRRWSRIRSVLPEDSNGPPAVILSMDIHLRYIIYWTLSIPSLRVLRSDAVSGHRRRWTIRGSIPLLMMFTAFSLHPLSEFVCTSLTILPSLLSTLMQPITDILSRAESTDFRVPEATLANLSRIIFAAQNHVLLGISYEQSNLKESVIEIVILTMFFGTYTFFVCSQQADLDFDWGRIVHHTDCSRHVYYLVRTRALCTTVSMFTCGCSIRGIAHKGHAFILMAIIAMWMSTVAYWIATLLVAVETQLTLRNIMTHALANVDQARSCVGFSSGGRPFIDCQSESPVKEVPDYLKVYGAQQCIGTVALTINVSMYTDSKDQRLTPVLSGYHR